MTRMTLHRLGRRHREDGIEPSCSVLDVAGRRVVVDCGLHPDRDGSTQGRGHVPDLSLLEDGRPIDMVCLTHAHTDHVGFAPALVPYLAKDARVVMTKVTRDLLPNVLREGLREKEGRLVMPYDANAYNATLARTEVIRRPGAYEIVSGLNMYVHPEGHIPGSCSFTFRADGRTIHFSGDRCSHAQPAIGGAHLLPKPWWPDVIAGSDCTYGADHASDGYTWRQEMDRCLDLIEQAMRDRRRVMVCAFGMHRFGAVMEEFARRRLPDLGRVVLDGGGWRTAQRINASGGWCDLDRPYRIPEATPLVSDERDRDWLVEERPLVMLTTPGMGGPAGPAVWWRRELLPDPQAMVVFTGYLAPDSDGYAIAQAAQLRDSTGTEQSASFEDGTSLPVRAQVERVRIGSHDSRGKIVEWFRAYAPKAAVLTHGSRAAYDSLVEELSSDITRIVRSDDETSAEIDL